MKTRTPQVQATVEEPWLLELEDKCRHLAALEQFGTMLEAISQAAMMHSVPKSELQRKVARIAIDLGHVQQLPQVDHIE